MASPHSIWAWRLPRSAGRSHQPGSMCWRYQWWRLPHSGCLSAPRLVETMSMKPPPSGLERRQVIVTPGFRLAYFFVRKDDRATYLLKPPRAGRVVAASFFQSFTRGRVALLSPLDSSRRRSLFAAPLSAFANRLYWAEPWT